MKHGKNQLKNLFCARAVDQIVIPEIQRDFVWETEHVGNLISSILADFSKEIDRNKKLENLPALDQEIRELIFRNSEKEKSFSNIGFIYAYQDLELPTTYFLIDGQQRITTIFLINLFLSVKESKQSYFERYYFANGTPKLDYRVRENAQDFIRGFIRHILAGNELATVQEQNWYHDEYALDVTIQSILENYQYIEEALGDEDLSLDYMENNVEFWFFDTQNSFQGENLYLYMNSRGEMVQGNENLKAALLEPLTLPEKSRWGGIWEDWQDFFWKNRAGKASADDGFNEFLRWILVLNLIPSSKETTAAIVKKIGAIKTTQKFPSDAFSLDKLQKYHNALERIIEYTEVKAAGMQILAGETRPIDYYRLLPCLYVASELPNIGDKELHRVVRFFFNTAKFEDVSVSIELRLIRGIELIMLLLAEAVFDIAKAPTLAEKGKFGSILTVEEIFKFKVYLQGSAEDRTKVETAFWKAEDLKLTYGQIDFIFDCMGISTEEDPIAPFDLLSFQRLKNSILKLVVPNDDLLRRALLTKGDYTFVDGVTTTLDATRYSLVNPRASWRYVWRHARQRALLKSLVIDFDRRLLLANASDRDAILQAIIDDFLMHAVDCEAWRQLVIEMPGILAYTNQNLFCRASDDLDDIYALQQTRATWGTYKAFLSFV